MEMQWVGLETVDLFLLPVYVYFPQVAKALIYSPCPQGYHLSYCCLMFYSLIKLIP